MAGAAMAVSKILGGAGSLLGIYGQYKDRIAHSHSQAFAAQVALNNAQLAKQDINTRKSGGRQERANISKSESTMRGEARVGSAAGNVAVDEGSALDVDVAIAEQSARERAASKDQEKVDVKRLNIERDTLLAEGKLLKKAAKRSKKSAKLGAIGGILQTVSGGTGK